jgi:hypothetical protein
MEKTREILRTCDYIDFSAKDAKENFVDDIGLNEEPLEMRRDAVRELLSQYKPRDNIDAALFRGTVFLRKGDAIMLKIALYESGFRIRGYYYEVLNPERNEIMLRLLNFHKLKEKSQSP